MYGRINASSSRSPSPNRAGGSNRAADTDRFAENVAGVASDLRPSSSSGEPRSYFLTSQPPIEEIDRSTFRREVKAFYGDDIKHIADNPQEYSGFVSLKALSAANVARGYANTNNDAAEARYFSYKLGDKSVGLLKTEGSLRVPPGGGRFHAQFPGRTEITSQVALRVTHPLVENAGDILLEHQLRLDGERPLVLSRPAARGAEGRLTQMGFAHVGRDNWVLDPAQHPEKWNNDDGEWRRTDKPTLYLSKSGDDHREASVETDSSDDDDPSWYFERLNIERDGNIERDRNIERGRAPRTRDDYTR